MLKQTLINFFKAIGSFFLLPSSALEVMTVSYDLTDNTIECLNWYGERIRWLSGKFSSEVWENIKANCRQGDFPANVVPHTVIYIWAGMEKKHLAYCEPITNYLNDAALLKTGQGFSWESGLRYGNSSRLKCKCCGKDL